MIKLYFFFSVCGICVGRTGLLFPCADLLYLLFMLSCPERGLNCHMCMFLHKAADNSGYCGADTTREDFMGLILYSDTISKSGATILRHGFANKGIHQTTSFMPWPSEKLQVTIIPLHKCTTARGKRRN